MRVGKLEISANGGSGGQPREAIEAGGFGEEEREYATWGGRGNEKPTGTS